VADLGRVAEAWPRYQHACYGQAAAYLAMGDLAGYRKAREGIIANFHDVKDARIVAHVCHISVDVPATADEARALHAMAQFAVASGAASARLTGATQFRQGNYEAAIEDFEKPAASGPMRAWSWLFLAMAHQKLGHVQEAKQSLAKAEEWIDQTNRNKASGLTDGWTGWYEPIEVDQILREAQALIR
jgi:Flp pilus assembly protein TadD